jgi:hypothetical protein
VLGLLLLLFCDREGTQIAEPVTSLSQLSVGLAMSREVTLVFKILAIVSHVSPEVMPKKFEHPPFDDGINTAGTAISFVDRFLIILGTHMRWPGVNAAQFRFGFSCCKFARVERNAPAIFVHVSPENMV